MIARSLFAFSTLSITAFAGPARDGHATAEWITGASSIEPGKPIQTGIRLKIDKGWHTYWTNPGDAGGKFKVAWTLPEGWTASEIIFPYPKRFLTGELPGYGYEDEVIFPVTLTPPATFSGTPELAGKASWLTCDESACVPGKVDLKLTLAATGAAEAVADAEKKIPKTVDGAKLVVREQGNDLDLTLTLPPGTAIDPAEAEVFPATEQAVDHYKPLKFEKSGPTWSAKAGKNEYADSPLKELRLVLVSKNSAPIEVVWKAAGNETE
jgi:DsbC/DsbD-like thiol-disulfide interchange protein